MAQFYEKKTLNMGAIILASRKSLNIGQILKIVPSHAQNWAKWG